MTRVRSLEGREAGIVARLIQGMFRLVLGRVLNPTKVQAHVSRAMLSSSSPTRSLGLDDGPWARTWYSWFGSGLQLARGARFEWTPLPPLAAKQACHEPRS